MRPAHRRGQILDQLGDDDMDVSADEASREAGEEGRADREWWVPGDLFPEDYDDPWLRGDQPLDGELYPLPAGLP